MRDKAPLWKKWTMDDPSQFGWKTKKYESTFFPDNWSKEKIKKEIGEAYGNMDKIKTDDNLWTWYTSEWIKIWFRIDDWIISSAYPLIKSK